MWYLHFLSQLGNNNFGAWGHKYSDIEELFSKFVLGGGKT